MVYILQKWVEKYIYPKKVDVPNSAPYPNHSSISESNVVRSGSKNGFQRDKCLKEIELHAQNMLTILNSIANTIGRTYTTI